MKGEQKIRIDFLLAAIAMFTMIPVYYFTMMQGLNWEEWLPIILFTATGILCLVSYFIKHMEHIRNKREW